MKIKREQLCVCVLEEQCCIRDVAPWDCATKYKFIFRQERGEMSRVRLILAGVSKRIQEYMVVEVF